MFRHCLMWSSGILLSLSSQHLTGKKIYSISDCLIEITTIEFLNLISSGVKGF